MHDGYPGSDPDENTILIDLTPHEACATACALLWYLSTRTESLTPLDRELRALALFLRDTLPPAWRERLEVMLLAPLAECA